MPRSKKLVISALCIAAAVGAWSAASGIILAQKKSDQKAAAAPPAVPPAPMQSALHASSDDPKEENAYFTVVGSFLTAQGAMRNLREIRRADLGADIAVYPPYYKISSYWTVVAAAYSTREEAETRAAYAKRNWGQKDVFIRRLPARTGVRPRPYSVYLPSVMMAEYPNLISPPAPATSPEASHFVFISELPNEEEANKKAEYVRHRLPGLNIAVYPPRIASDPWRIALAAHATAEQALTALALARRLNLAEAPPQIVLKAAEVLAWRTQDRNLTAIAHTFRKRVEACYRDGSVTMGDMRACAGAWVTPQALVACVGNSNAPETNMPPLAEAEACVAIPDTLEGATLIAKRGLSVLTQLTLEASNYYKLTDTALTTCLEQARGDSAALQQCLLPKLFTPAQKLAVECLQNGSPAAVQACLREAAVTMAGPEGQQVAKCMANASGTLEGVSECLPAEEKQSLQRLQKFRQCVAGAASEKDFIKRCIPEINVAADARAKCVVDAGGDQQKLTACVMQEVPGGQDLLQFATCTKKADRDPAKLAACGMGSIPSAITVCFTAAGSSSAQIQECLNKADGRFAAAEKLSNCVQGAAGDPAVLIRTCANDIIPADSQNLAVCLLAKGGDVKVALTTCGALPPNAEEVIETASCIHGAGKDPTLLSECLVSHRPNYKAALETALCVKQSGGDSSKLAACAAARVGGTAGAVAQCLASQPAGTRDPLKCVAAADPRLAEAQKVYNCAQKARDVASAIAACSDGVIDQKTQKAVTCISKANGDRAALAACAGQAILPGEAGRLAGCAASSQGAASFGVCALAPNVNEEFRIASECAVSTGGEPISFASCTGGRLTIRELSKCVGGKIGEDCFGPNNTIRKYYENMFNDLTKGPGPNNEIVKAINVVGQGLKALGDGVEHAAREIAKEADRRKNNAQDRLSKPLSQPGKTLECIITFGNSC